MEKRYLFTHRYSVGIPQVIIGGPMEDNPEQRAHFDRHSSFSPERAVEMFKQESCKDSNSINPKGVLLGSYEIMVPVASNGDIEDLLPAIEDGEWDEILWKYPIINRGRKVHPSLAQIGFNRVSGGISGEEITSMLRGYDSRIVAAPYDELKFRSSSLLTYQKVADRYAHIIAENPTHEIPASEARPFFLAAGNIVIIHGLGETAYQGLRVFRQKTAN